MNNSDFLQLVNGNLLLALHPGEKVFRRKYLKINKIPVTIVDAVRIKSVCVPKLYCPTF